jgi:hypothetical protein
VQTIITHNCSPNLIAIPDTVNYSVAKFCKIAPEIHHQHHDALAFPDGSTVFVDSLLKGQRVRVLQLPVTNKQVELQNPAGIPKTETA